jgi:hypothetical protein
MHPRPNYWHDEMSEEVARRVLGSRHFDYAVLQGEAFCIAAHGGAWQANDPEHYGAYRCAARAAARNSH